MEKGAKIYVAGHTGLVGSALVRALESAGHTNLVLRSHAELELTDGGHQLLFQRIPLMRRTSRMHPGAEGHHAA